MEVTLVVIRGKVNRGEIAFQPPAVLGRSREADLTIAHPMVSRHHCELFEVDGLLMVRDLGSLNGTMIHDRRVVQAALCPDESFSVGPLTFQVRYQYDGDRNAVPPPTLAEPVPATRPAGIAPMGESPRPVETPRFLDTGLEPVAVPSAEAGPWSNALPAEEDGPLASALPAEEAVAAAETPAPVEESPQFAPWSEPPGGQASAAGTVEIKPSAELVPVSGAEATEEAGLAVGPDEVGESMRADEMETVKQEPEKKKRRFLFWPFGGDKKSPKATARQGKPAPKHPAALPGKVKPPAASPESTLPTVGAEDTPHDEAVADFLMQPDSPSEEPEVAAEPAEPDVPSEPSGEDDAFQDFLKGIP